MPSLAKRLPVKFRRAQMKRRFSSRSAWQWKISPLRYSFIDRQKNNQKKLSDRINRMNWIADSVTPLQLGKKIFGFTARSVRSSLIFRPGLAIDKFKVWIEMGDPIR